ncbi:MAG: PAS domain S-box protein [Rhodothermus sp.]|nr:PAS domain S-box protein [Rhodothermus sp.]
MSLSLQKRHFWLDPAGIALFYWAAGLLWIFLSDLFLLRVSSDPVLLVRWRTVTGIGFVTLSALVLFGLMRIGRRMLVEQAGQLKESEARYRLLFEHNPRPMWVYDLETLRFLAVNRAAVSLYGYSAQEFLDMTILDIRPREERAKVAASVWAPRSAFRHSGTWRHLTKDGRLLEVEIDSHLIEWEGRTAVMVLVQDVTERNRVARENARYREGLERLLEVSRQLMMEPRDWEQRQQDLVTVVQELVPSAEAVLLWRRVEDRFVLVQKVGGPEELQPGFSVPLSAALMRALEAFERLSPQEAAALQARTVPALRTLKAALVAPIHIEHRLEGVICADSFARADAFASYEQALLRSLAAIASVTWYNARLFEQLRQLSRRLLVAHEEERRRIARELHDEVGALLTSAQLCLGMAQAAVPETASMLAQHLAEARQLIERLSQEIRQLTLQLRPPLLDELGLVGALQAYIERYQQQTGITVHLDVRLDPAVRLSELVELTAYRFVQEALTNVARHARTSEARVQVQSVHPELLLMVEDQGIGFDVGEISTTSRSMGLAAMRERIELLGGRLEIASQPGRGTRLKALLPFHEEASRPTVTTVSS